MERIRVKAGEEGSIPRIEKAIKQEGKTAFTIFASEPGISRFGVEVYNKSRKPEEITLNIDWGDGARESMQYLDCLFIKQERDTDWKMATASVKGTIGTLRINLLPGKTLVYLNPKYNYTDNEKFVERVNKSELIEKKKAGESGEKRNIWLLKMGSGNEKVLVMARNHAYESAGNYCVEGMVDWLLSDDSLAGYFLSKFTFHFLPMTNPDGVHNGLGYLTPKGANLNRIVTVPDKAHETIKRVLDEVRPSLFVNIHHWKNKFVDGLLCLNGKFARKVAFYMPDQAEYGKRWNIEDLEAYFNGHQSYVIPETIKSWKDYCEEKFGSIGLTYEFPWFGRNGRIMKETGVKALKAVLFSRLTP